MKNIFSNIRRHLEGMLLGIIIGILGCSFVYHKLIQDSNNTQSNITTNNTSGAPLVIEKIFTKNKKTTIDTSYSGAGSSTITIPNKSIPSANKWDNDHWLAGGFVTTDKSIFLCGGYRYDRYMIVGGPWFRNNNGYSGGVWIGGIINF